MKANKEKALAEKRERERLRAMREQEKREQLANYATASSVNSMGTANFAGALVSGGLGAGGSTFGQFDGADLVAALGSASGVFTSRGPPEPPKDRSTLATMRVIRRNLVYAVGMPPNIATEENLRKPEYFGEYGKISKIVINRNHNPGDPRRASASAYVTFAHKVRYMLHNLCGWGELLEMCMHVDHTTKLLILFFQEDTLACILALDGFYHDGRNIRASYGTSKYCSAFIKNVRCNNPDCTYLHHMGDAEDTFTKQEIQAGYVTSGRDVLARQQQIMAQQAAAVYGAGGAAGRRKVGGGGPSGTGKASASPVFPPPTYDEPLPKKVRSQAAILQARAMQHHNNLSSGMGGAGAPSAASIVAGIGATPAAPPAPHTTLTPLTPLKRSGSMPLTGKSAVAASVPAAPSSGGLPKAAQPLVGGSSDLTPAESLALQKQQEEAALAQQQQQQREMALKNANNKKKEQQQSSSTPNSPSHSSVGSSGSRGSKKDQQTNGTSAKINQQQQALKNIPAIGSTQPTQIGAIGGSSLPNMGSPLLGSSSFGGNLGVGEPLASTGGNSLDLAHTGSGILGGQPLAFGSENLLMGGSSLAPSGNQLGGLGLLSGDPSASTGVDKWGAAGGQNMFGGSGALWGGANDTANKPAPIGPANGRGISNSAPGGDVGGMSLFGTNQNAFSSNGSSALANMLGIQLPTGSGSLRESSTPFGNPIQQQQQQHAPVGSVGSVGATIGGPVGAIGANKPSNNGMLQPIGAPSSAQSVPIGGYTGGSNNDMALLQSLLPGVNITSGNAHRAAAPQYHNQQQPVGVASLNQGSTAQWNQGNQQQQQQQQQAQEQQRSGNTIW